MLYSYEAGKDFSFGLFKKNPNCCFDKENGILYTDNIKNFEKLGLNSSEIKEEKKESVFVKEIINDKQAEITEILQTCSELIEEKIKLQEEKKQKQLTELTAKLYQENKELKDKYKILENIFKDLVDIQKENQELDTQEQIKQQNLTETLKNSVGVLNKKIKNSNEEIENLKTKFEALIEIVTEQRVKQTFLPNLATIEKMDLQKIWNIATDKNSAALLSIMLMVKKIFEEKGHRL
jgi:hypothetical protein